VIVSNNVRSLWQSDDRTFWICGSAGTARLLTHWSRR
jgi:hypothetical protein